MIIYSIFLLISLFLESIIPNLINNFIPFFIISLIILVNIFNLDLRKIVIITFIFGVLYDLLYTDFIILHGFLFAFILYVTSSFINDRKNFFLMLVFYYVSCVFYSLFIYLISFLYTNVYILDIVNIFLSSIIINTMYFIIIYLIFILVNKIITNKKRFKAY